MLLKPDNLPSLTTSYRPISPLSSIIKLFEEVIEQRLHSYLEDIGFINEHQSGFRQSKSTDDHLFRLSQSAMESFNRGEHVVAAFLDVEKALTMFGTMDSGIPFSYLTFPLKSLSYPSQGEGFPFRQNQPYCRGTKGFCPESITFPDIHQ